MSISYAGVDLLRPDHDGVLRRWLEGYHDVAWQALYGATVAERTSGRFNPRRPQPGSVGIPTPNYSTLSGPIRFNVLFWPTGALRWGTFIGLVDQEGKDKILQNVAPGRAFNRNAALSEQPLILGDGKTSLQIPMFLLEPKPITADTIKDQQLWMLPLVDQRYFWQRRSIGEYELFESDNVTGRIDWGLLETAIQIAINSPHGLTSDPPSGAYMEPDRGEGHRRFESVALMLEAIAWSTGRRVWVDFNGRVTLGGWDRSLDNFNQNDTQLDLLAGGIAENSPLPEKFTVAFRYWRDGIILDWDDEVASVNAVVPNMFGVTHELPDNKGYLYRQGWEVAFFSTMFAKIGYDSTVGSEAGRVRGSGANPDNYGSLYQLAEAIRDDYLRQRENSYDFTFAGIRDWWFSGYDDYALIDFGSCPDELPRWRTRVASLSSDVAAMTNWSQDQSLVVLPEEIFGVTAGTCTAFDPAENILGFGPFDVWQRKRDHKPGSDGNIQDIEDTDLTSITVFNLATSEIGGNMYAQAKRVGNVWMYDFVECTAAT